MASPSKEEHLRKLILENSPLKEWHFEEVVKEARVTKAVANKWLKKYVKEGLLQHRKEKGKFPYFTVGSNSPVYYSCKRLFALEQLHRSGLLPKLFSFKRARAVILFGSMIRGDWYKDSDVDIFVLGDVSEFNKNIYEQRLKRHIEMHFFHDKAEIAEVKTGLIKNILNGYIVKGNLQDIL